MFNKILRVRYFNTFIWKSKTFQRSQINGLFPLDTWWINNVEFNKNAPLIQSLKNTNCLIRITVAVIQHCECNNLYSMFRLF